MSMGAILVGLLTGLSLIMAIGAQNAYVLRMGLSRHHIGLIVAICAMSDIVLIVLGIAGIGSVIRSASWALQVLRWVGVAYLSLFALRSSLVLASASSRGAASLRCEKTSIESRLFDHVGVHLPQPACLSRYSSSSGINWQSIRTRTLAVCPRGIYGVPRVVLWPRLWSQIRFSSDVAPRYVARTRFGYWSGDAVDCLETDFNSSSFLS